MDFAGLNITEKLILEAEVEKKKNVFLICLKVFLRSTFWLGEQENGQQKLCQKLASFFAKVRLCVWLDDYFFATYSNKTLPNSRTSCLKKVKKFQIGIAKWITKLQTIF